MKLNCNVNLSTWICQNNWSKMRHLPILLHIASEVEMDLRSVVFAGSCFNISNNECLLLDQAHDGLHRARSQWKGWGNRCKGRGGVQHRKGASGPAAEVEDHGVLWEEGKAGRTPEKDVGSSCNTWFLIPSAPYKKRFRVFYRTG